MVLTQFRSGDYEAGFNSVLSKSDLEATRWAIGAVPGTAGEACQNLSQTVLLCLLQQLGASIAKKKDDFELELGWIETASLRLDSEDRSIKNHLDKVKKQVVGNLANLAKNGGEGLDGNRVEVIKRIVRGI